MSQFPTTTVQDPAVPMIALPAQFRSRRQVTNVRPEAIPESNCVEILDVAGPGAVRHIWLLHGTGRRLEITVDGATEPQVDVPFDPFFGVMHDLKPYPVDCAAYTVLPNFHTPGVPGTPGYNLFLPIPFSRSCRIRLHLPPGLEQRAVSTMVDWQQYDAGTDLTPFRLGAEHHRYLPAPPRNRAYRIADVTGSGFIAGVVLGARQRNHTDMVYHTGGMSILIDGEDDPHVIRGINMEDDFGYSWGFHERQSRWIGSPYHRRRGRNDQDGVIYRFFGPDPIAFRSSISLRCGSRDDDIETVAYYYRVAGSEAGVAPVLTPERWLVTGFYDGGGDWQRFSAAEEPETVPLDRWRDHFTDHPGFIRELPANRGWIDFRFSGIDPALAGSNFVNRSMYAAGALHCPRARQATLRISCDDWLIAWLNGTRVATLRHEAEFQTARIPVTLNEGRNTILIKNNNLHHSHGAWVANLIVEEG